MSWDLVAAELDRRRDAGRTTRFWLRDDDAVAVTPALERLDRICAGAGMPVLLAVIPARAEARLGTWIAQNRAFVPCQHGFAHTNHAPAGERACELGPDRPIETVIDELARGRERLKTLFGQDLSSILVPPWNRMDPALIPRLPALGFDRLSTFGPVGGDQGGMPKLNADLDIIDWRNGRVGRDFTDVARKLAALLAAAGPGDRPIGILTHHLAHDATAWAVLEKVLGRLRAHPGTAFATAASV